MCIDPDSDSDVVIEEGEGDFRECCIIVKGEERNIEEEAEQADDKQSWATHRERDWAWNIFDYWTGNWRQRWNNFQYFDSGFW